MIQIFADIALFAEFDPCKERPCKNGATCGILGQTYKCGCRKHYHGIHCEGTCEKTVIIGINRNYAVQVNG